MNKQNKENKKVKIWKRKTIESKRLEGEIWTFKK